MTTAFLLALGTTIGYFAGLVPVVPKTLPTFVDLMMVTAVLLVITVFSWTIAVVGR